MIPTDHELGSIDKIAPKLGVSFETTKLFIGKIRKIRENHGQNACFAHLYARISQKRNEG